ncbi:hypothetical protein [Streptomyces sp. NPDC058661]|uniref:hypothetical protein n=1 Tax=Streptomyces sp. NPDC058661 TaxID=3346582 RepID=UPI003665890F
MEYRRAGSIEEEFAALMGPDIGEIWWSSLIRADVPDCDIHGGTEERHASWPRRPRRTGPSGPGLGRHAAGVW